MTPKEPSESTNRFPRTKAKLEDSRTILEQLKASTDGFTFQTIFSAFLNASRSITNALQKEGKHIPQFEDWYKKKQDEMKADPLLRFLHEARTKDFHEGKYQMSFRTHIRNLDVDSIGKPPAPNAGLTIGARGSSWIINKGTPQERRIPIKHPEISTWAKIKDAPTMHLGKQLTDNTPVTICQLAVDYFAKLVYEAQTHFSTQDHPLE